MFVSREWYVHRVHQFPAEQEHTKQSTIVLDAHETTVGEPSALSNGVNPTASVGKAHSNPLAQSPETKLQIMPIEDLTVDEGTDGEAVAVQRQNVVVVGREPTKLEVEHHVASGHAQHRTWCDACMRARGIAGAHERREPGREDEDPLVAIDHVYLNLDGTEDDDDDNDDEATQNKLLILVAKDVKKGTFAATCLREKGVSEYATSWLVALLHRLEYRRAILQRDGEPSIVFLKTATLLASPLVELVLREKVQLESTPRMVLVSLPCVR